MGGKLEKFLDLITGGGDRAKPLPPAEGNRDDYKSDLFRPPQAPADPLEPQIEKHHHVEQSPLQGTHHEPDGLTGKPVDHTADHSHGKLRNL